MFFSLAYAAPPPCGTPDVLAALAGGPAAHPAMLTAPPLLDGRPRSGAEDKQVYGGHYEFWLDTPNFTINWWDSRVDPAAADAAAEALEGAWTALVEEQGWEPPVSSDQYLIWVLLDPDLGYTGWTTEYTTDLYPQGYPVIYLDPAWLSSPEFYGALAAHEFMHSIQYALREYTGGASEPWYWEASANWASELADPDRDGYQYASEWYATQADLAFDSTAGSHQYGMFVFNAWLEEHQTGPDGMKAVWELSAEDPAGWDQLLADSTGVTTADLWGGFTGAYANHGLAESDQYTDVRTEGPLEDGVSGSLPQLGTHYYRVEASVRVSVTGDAVLGGPSGHGTSLVVAPGEVIGVTMVTPGDYTLLVEENVDTGGDPPDDDAADTGDEGEETSGGCGCDATGGMAAAAWMAPLLALLRRRPSRLAARPGHREVHAR
jgi:hypothetical protein